MAFVSCWLGNDSTVAGRRCAIEDFHYHDMVSSRACIVRSGLLVLQVLPGLQPYSPIQNADARSLMTHHYILYFSQQTARLILVEFLDTYLVQGTRARKRRFGTKMVKEVAARESSHGEQPRRAATESSHGEQPRLLQVSQRRQNRDQTARRQYQNLPAHPRPRPRIPRSRWKGVYQSRSWTTTVTRSKRIRRPCDSTGKAACYSLPYAASNSSFWYVAKKAVLYL